MSRQIAYFLVIAAFVSSGCSRAPEQPPAPPTVSEVTVPIGKDSEEPNVSVAPDGRVFVSWLEPVSPDDYTFKLMFTVRDNQGTWAEPKMIGGAADWFVNDADFPSMTVLADGTLVAHWLGNNEPGTEAYDVNIVMSKDNGATWSKPIVPHRDKVKTQHGFVSLVPGTGGRLDAIWLDGRKISEEGEGDMALMHTSIAADGTLGPESVLDTRVCECCQTSAAVTPEGLVAVYRDRTEQEVRDISVVRYANGAWSQPEPLSRDNWEINACPVNGPAISTAGQNAAVAWFTGAGDKLRVYAVMSTDGGKTFGQPVQIDDGRPDGRVDVVSLPNGGALVSWMERTDNGAEIRLKRVDPNGVAQPSIPVSGAARVRSGSFARMERSGNQAVIAWSAGGEEPRVRVATFNFDR
jgi:hypothetical protein